MGGVVKKVKKGVKKVVGGVKKGVKEVGDLAGNVADWTKDIPGINAFTSQLALLDDPSKFADIWKKNILPQYAAGAALMGGNYLMGGVGQQPLANGEFQIGNTIYGADGNILREVTGGGGGSGGLGGLLGGAGSFLGNNALASVLGLGGSLAGGYMSANAAKDASKAQADAAKYAANLAHQQFMFQQLQQEPFRQAGLTGQNRMMDLLGLSRNTGAAGYGKYAKDCSMQDFQADPGYAFRLSEGLKGLDRQAAARGGLISGGALKAAQRYGQDMASNEYQNAFNRYQVNRSNQLNPLQSLAGQAQTAANTVGQASQNYANTAGEAMMGAGNARASGYMGQANAWNNALGQMLNYYQSQQLLGRL